EVRFDPAAPGQQGSFVGVETTGGSPVATLSGKATDFTFSATPSSLEFGEQRLDTSSGAQTVTIGNLGDAPMNLGEVEVNGEDASDFELGADTCTANTVEPGEECTVEVSFAPSETGPRAASLGFGGDTTALVPLAGTGVAPALLVAPNPLSYGSH